MTEVELEAAEPMQSNRLRQTPSQTDLLFTASIGGKVRQFRVPKNDLASLFELAMATESTTPQLVYAAAIGLCWLGAGKPKAAGKGLVTNVADYGRKVANELYAQGVGFADVLLVGMELFGHCMTVLPKSEAVEDNKSFLGDKTASDTTA